MKSERERGITLRLLDLDTIEAKTRQEIQDQRENYDLKVTIGFGPYGIAGAGGKLYAVCSEGVGYEVTEDEPLELQVFVSSPGHMAIAPAYLAKLDPGEVMENLLDEEIDLADLVRVFGARLEQNFWLWHRTLARADYYEKAGKS